MEIINKPEKIYLCPALAEDFSQKQFTNNMAYYSKELMFEFAEWIGQKQYTYDKVWEQAMPTWFDNTNHALDCNTEQLFKEFLKTREE